MSSELLPCPFKHSVRQGSLASDYEPYSTDSLSEDSNWCVCCPVCKSATGYYNTEAQARHAWNYRATSPPNGAAQPQTCEKCGHAGDLFNGICQTQIGARNWAYCHCRCVFPATKVEAPDVEWLDDMDNRLAGGLPEDDCLGWKVSEGQRLISALRDALNEVEKVKANG